MMEIRPWVISVLSTDYDLIEQRKAIIAKLRESNVMVSAFELPDWPVESGIHSHDTCLKALDRVDIALLIINDRYGGIYYGDIDNPISITQKEYLSVVQDGKPCFTFVSRKAWDSRHTYKSGFKTWVQTHPAAQTDEESAKLKNEYEEKYRRENKDSVSIEVINFIETIQQSFKTYRASNWIDQFDSIPDLLSRIEGKLKGHTRFLLETIVDKQKGNLEKRHTSTGLSLSLGDVFSRGYYLEPSYVVESGMLGNGNTLDDSLHNTIAGNTSVLIYGEAGYGKTTILAKSYLSHVSKFLEQKSYHIPFYLWLKNKTPEYHFSFNRFIDESMAADLGMEPYPYMELSQIHPYFYFDGFDEIAEKMMPNEIEKIGGSSMFSYPVLLTTRQQYTWRYINNYSFSDLFAVRVKINTWDEDMVQRYIANFCCINGKSEDFASQLKQWFSDRYAFQDVLNSPLLVTMFLWIIESNRMRIPGTIYTRVGLFKTYIFELAKRELVRQKQSEALAPQLVVLWSYAAWEFYHNKLKGIDTKYEQLIQRLNQRSLQMPFSYSETYFEALFDSNGEYIFGTFHEQFLEYLVGNLLNIACSNGKSPYPEFLGYVVRPEINRYFRAVWYDSADDQKDLVINNLHKQYFENLGDDSFDAVSKRVHAIYHIGRLDNGNRDEMMSKAFNMETHISVILSLYFGAIKIGHLDKEQHFYELLKTNDDYNEANRGYHVTYYSDVIMGTQLPFKDDPTAKWDGTLRAFIRHFESKDEEHYYLRRIDLVTMIDLIRARNKVEPLTKEIVDSIGQRVSSSIYANKHQAFQIKIEEAYSELKELFESTNTSSLICEI